MASFRKRGKVWEARFSYIDKHGKRQYIQKSGFASKKSAQEYANKLGVDLAEQHDLANHDDTLVDYFLRWYQTFREPRIADETKQKYSYTAKVITKYFGNQKLSEITTTDYQEFLNDFGKTHSKETISKINSHTRAAVRNAINDGIISSDFTLNTHLVYDPERTRPLTFLNLNEAEQVINYLESNWSYEKIWDCWMLIALLTGMREAEIGGLTWDNVDFQHKEIKVRQAWSQKNQDFKPLKNTWSNRVIPVGDSLLDMLEQLKLQQHTALTTGNVANPKNLVLMTKNQKITQATNLNEHLRTMLKRNQIKKYMVFHDLRHTHASLLLYHRISIPYISKRLGHKNVTITINTYLHIIRELQDEESKKSVIFLEDVAKGRLGKVTQLPLHKRIEQ